MPALLNVVAWYLAYMRLSELIPFLVIAVGVENIFIVSNAVVSTPLNLAVRERIGQGLSRVASKITVTAFTECVAMMILATSGIPALQEFCIFTFVSVLIDYVLQMSFFVTVLSIDIRRLELHDLQRLCATAPTKLMQCRRRCPLIRRNPCKP